MRDPGKWSRILVIVGLAALVLGMLDPLEGSIVILAGAGFVVLGSSFGHSRYRTELLWAFALVLAGVCALWGLSAFGGIGGTSGHSLWWALILLPYPAGWLLAMFGAIQRLREFRTSAHGAMT